MALCSGAIELRALRGADSALHASRLHTQTRGLAPDAVTTSRHKLAYYRLVRNS